jgi:spermidine synthase
VLSACLLTSGAAALVYEVVWVRLLSLVMGHTVYALAAVLTAFLGGLALGAEVGGRFTANRPVSPRLYAGLELGIAVFAVAMPFLIGAMTPLFGMAYRWLYGSFVAYNVVQFAICGALLVVPTVLMGMTLPVVAALLLADGADVGRGAGSLYAMNSFGGVLGAGLAGLVLLPGLGMEGTSFVAAGLNGVAALAALLLGRGWRSAQGAAAVQAPAPPPAADWPAPPLRLVIALYGLAGFASLALEVGWARIVSLSIGSTTYGFTVTLVTFIAGLAAGSALAARTRALLARPVLSLVALHAVIAFASLLSLPFLGALPVHVVRLVGLSASRFSTLLAGEFLLVASTVLVPTLAMGAAFPLVATLVHRAVGSSGRAVGSAYAANTWGNILGSFCAGFVLVPAIGMRGTIVLSAGLGGLVALGYLLGGIRERPWGTAVAAIALVATLAVAAVRAPDWDRAVVTSGPYLYAPAILEAARRDASAGTDRATAIREAMAGRFERIVDYREGASTVVAVKMAGGAIHLEVGGKVEAMRWASTQHLIAHLPLLLHAEPRDVLVVGLGGGVTLASALRHPVEHVTCVEISPEVRDMAREHFGPFLDGALDDPRATLVIGDARNHLRHVGRTYDVIVSQPSNPWISGAASLFTREFFADVRAHLAPGGIASAWFIATDDAGDTLRSVLRTWNEVFPASYLFESRNLGEYVLLGLRDPAPLSAARVAAGLARPAVASDLGRLRILEPADLFGYLFLGPDELRAFASEGVVNTDDNAFIEFTAPRGLHTVDPLRQLEAVHAHRADPLRWVSPDLGTPETTAAFVQRVSAIHESKGLVLEARKRARRQEGSWRRFAERAAALNPEDPFVQSVARRPGASM